MFDSLPNLPLIPGLYSLLYFFNNNIMLSKEFLDLKTKLHQNYLIASYTNSK